jgi:hypothetical protein
MQSERDYKPKYYVFCESSRHLSSESYSLSSTSTSITSCYNFLCHVTVGPMSNHVGGPAQLLELQLAYFVLGVTLMADSGLGDIICVLVSLV